MDGSSPSSINNVEEFIAFYTFLLIWKIRKQWLLHLGCGKLSPGFYSNWRKQTLAIICCNQMGHIWTPKSKCPSKASYLRKLCSHHTRPFVESCDHWATPFMTGIVNKVVQYLHCVEPFIFPWQQHCSAKGCLTFHMVCALSIISLLNFNPKS